MTRNARGQSRRPRYKAAAHVPNFTILVPAPELSLSDAKNNPFRKMRDTLYRERQLWIGNESIEIRYVSSSSVAGTSALSPGVPRQMFVTKGIKFRYCDVLDTCSDPLTWECGQVCGKGTVLCINSSTCLPQSQCPASRNI